MSKRNEGIKRHPMPKEVTYIVAPGIPANEVLKLRKEYERNGDIVKSYEVHIITVEIPCGSRLLVIAPGVPQSEVKQLRKHFKEAERDPSYTVVTNYEIRAWAVPKRPRS